MIYRTPVPFAKKMWNSSISREIFLLSIRILVLGLKGHNNPAQLQRLGFPMHSPWVSFGRPFQSIEFGFVRAFQPPCQVTVHGCFRDPTFTLIPSYAFPAT